MKPYYDHAGIQIFHGDCREVLPALVVPDDVMVVTDPPYLTGQSNVPIRGGGVVPRVHDSVSVGLPWGYGLGWVDDCERLNPKHWVVFANYQMLASLCSRLEPQTVFVWRKTNAPRMTRPVPRLDCEFIVWCRTGGLCDSMKEFDSQVIDVPMPQAGCFATERILEVGSGKAAHPCQKPLAIVRPFVTRLSCETVVDPFMGTGTTLRVSKDLARRAIGIEIEERYCEIAANRLRQEVLFA